MNKFYESLQRELDNEWDTTIDSENIALKHKQYDGRK